MSRRRSDERLSALFVSAAPNEVEQVDWERAQELVRTAFQESLPRDEFEIAVLADATPETLRQECGRRNPHIVHFCGHGETSEAGTHLVLQDDRGDKVLVDPSRFFGILTEASRPRLVVLAACETSAVIETNARKTGEDDFTMLADTLVKGGISAVVANQAPIHESSAQAFTLAFYECLFRTGDVDFAVHSARCHLYFAGTRRAHAGLEWGVPTVHRHIRSARLFRSE
jgi:CHAT domain-containing protein